MVERLAPCHFLVHAGDLLSGAPSSVRCASLADFAGRMSRKSYAAQQQRTLIPKI